MWAWCSSYSLFTLQLFIVLHSIDGIYCPYILSVSNECINYTIVPLITVDGGMLPWDC